MVLVNNTSEYLFNENGSLFLVLAEYKYILGGGGEGHRFQGLRSIIPFCNGVGGGG